MLPVVGLLHHALKEILAVRVQPGLDFGEVGPQPFGHDYSRLPQILGVVRRAHTGKRQSCCDVPLGTEGTGDLNLGA